MTPAATAASDAIDPGDPWDEVVAAPELISQLRAAARDHTHAYLFLGHAGVGTRAAARAFAAEILVADSGAVGADADRHRRLARRERHPALAFVERTGASITVDQARDVVRRAAMAPPEGPVQVFVLVDFHLVAGAAPTLLKSIEEPTPGTVFIVLADEITPELVTIASRCARFEFPLLPTDLVRDRLVADGVDVDVATAAARSAGGDLERARLLSTDTAVVERRDFWMRVPERLDGTGATAAALVTEALLRIEEVAEPLSRRQEGERAAVEQEIEQFGVRRSLLKEVDERHKRERRRVHNDEIGAGLVAIMDRYRASASAVPAAYVDAADAVSTLTERLVHNVGEELAMQALFLSFPRLG